MHQIASWALFFLKISWGSAPTPPRQGYCPWTPLGLRPHLKSQPIFYSLSFSSCIRLLHGVCFFSKFPWGPYLFMCYSFLHSRPISCIYRFLDASDCLLGTVFPQNFRGAPPPFPNPRQGRCPWTPLDATPSL